MLEQDWGNDARLAGRKLRTSGGTSLSHLTFAYDNDDNITGITDAVDATKNFAYAYDVNGRLERVDTANGALRRTDYAHDKGGNRTSVAYRALPGDANPVSSDTYTRTAGTNRLASITTPGGTRSISYDARGNTSAETRPAGVSVSTSYDGYGRLTGYTRTGDPAQINVYNGLDDRVAVTSGGTTRRYVFDADGRVMGEYGTNATNVIAEFIWLNPQVGDGSAFGGDDGIGGYSPLAVASGPVATPTLLWVHGNHLGVPQVYTTSSGALASPGVLQLPGFPGQSRTLADLYYNRHRDYDPSTGRYIQADPIGLEGDVNPYLYALSNPMRYVDPTGEFGVAGFGVGMVTDIGVQMLFEDRSWKCVSIKRALISGALGAIGAPAWTRFAGGGLRLGMSRANSAFPRGVEWIERSKFWPKRWGGTYSKYNVNPVWGTDHAMMDPLRHWFLKRSWKDNNVLPNPATRFWRRIPYWFKGAVGAGGAGSVIQGAAGECGCD